MYKDKRIIGIITARGGSTSIPRKNLAELSGKPLIWYTIDAAQKSRLLTRTVVSTDNQEIARVSREYGADIPFMRPVELAQDDTPHLPVVQHALAWLKDNEGQAYDYVMILQPTSPLRTADDIDSAIKKAVETDADSVMSMVALSDFDPVKVKEIDGDVIRPLFGDEGASSALRQNGKKAYKRNCAIYLTKTEHIMNNDLFGTVSRAYSMPSERSVDINEPQDLEFAEFLLSKKV
ncbi:MAG: acylneuraminate cytidylyltransferase family protein [Parcubacteria group bacterium]|nr:acylneuraminate cytidylyltransferase family protein [Parcubacteria group bacterium]